MSLHATNTMGQIQATQQTTTLAPAVLHRIKLAEYPIGQILDYLEHEALENVILDFDSIGSLREHIDRAGEALCGQKPPSHEGHRGSASAPRLESGRNSDASVAEILEQSLASERGLTLQQHLRDQLLAQDIPARERVLCEAIIDDLDEHGFLPDAGEGLRAMLCAERKPFLEALRTVQALDPAGVASSSTWECLLAQIRAENDDAALLHKLVLECYDLLCAGRIKEIRQALGIRSARMERILAMLGNLNPCPARGFAGKDAAAISGYALTYDIFFTVGDDAAIEVSVSGKDSDLTQLINAEYAALAHCPDTREDVREYLAGMLDRADSIIGGIDQRLSSLERLGMLIASTQRDYILTGDSQLLRPLTMQEAADALHVSLSLISRLVKDKYAWTPHGAKALHDFFSRRARASSIESQSHAVSNAMLDCAIKAIIEEEDPERPLSDSRITETLEARYGYHLSRRAVAKHREKLGIGGRPERKAVYAIKSASHQ